MKKASKWFLKKIKLLLIFLPVLFFGSMGVSVLLGVIFERGDYDYEDVYDLSSKSSYTSGDSLTDIVLNYYSGVSDLPSSVKAEIYRVSLLKDFGEESLYSLDTISQEGMRSFIERNRIPLEEMFTPFPDSIESYMYYNFVWNTYLSCGKPKIRFSHRTPFPFSVAGVSGYYNPFSKVLFMENVCPLFSCEIFDQEEYFYWSTGLFLEELAHAKQFKEKPFTSYAKANWGLVRSLYKSICANCNPFLEDKSWSDAYKDEYNIKGSFEYEAHKDIYFELSQAGLEMGKFFIEN